MIGLAGITSFLLTMPITFRHHFECRRRFAPNSSPKPPLDLIRFAGIRTVATQAAQAYPKTAHVLCVHLQMQYVPMTNDNLPRGLFTGVAISVLALSAAVGRAFRETLSAAAQFINDVAGACSRVIHSLARRAITQYIRFEARVAALGVDVAITVYAARYLAIIVGIGVILAMLRFWIWFGLYCTFVGIAFLGYFRPASVDTDEAAAAHDRTRLWLRPLAVWTLRIFVAAFGTAGTFFFWSARDVGVLELSSTKTVRPSIAATSSPTPQGVSSTAYSRSSVLVGRSGGTSSNASKDTRTSCDDAPQTRLIAAPNGDFWLNVGETRERLLLRAIFSDRRRPEVHVDVNENGVEDFSLDFEYNFDVTARYVNGRLLAPQLRSEARYNISRTTSYGDFITKGETRARKIAGTYEYVWCVPKAEVSLSGRSTSLMLNATGAWEAPNTARRTYHFQWPIGTTSTEEFRKRHFPNH